MILNDNSETDQGRALEEAQMKGNVAMAGQDPWARLLNKHYLNQ